MHNESVTKRRLVAATVLACAAALIAALPAQAGLVRQAVGIYTDQSTLFQSSVFSANPLFVECGVGTENLALPTGANLGPFEMLMYSETIDSYDVSGTTIVITGTMRSITRLAGSVIDDAIHPFVAVAQDSVPPAKDRWDLYYITPFWRQVPNLLGDPLGSLLCTPSNVIPGGCKFGGEVFIGNVNASSTPQN
jgi:hypothetical protein